MYKYPLVEKNGNSLSIFLVPESQGIEKRTIDFVLDFNFQGELIGIEALNLKTDLGRNCLRVLENISSDHELFTYSFDEDCDAFYLKIKADHSSDQCSIEGEVLLNSEIEITGFCLILPSNIKDCE